MSRRIEFTVYSQLPPKKDGAVSMWSKSTEVPRLVALRRAAAERFAGTPPLHTAIRLELEIHFAEGDITRAGDLDSFVAGVCDGFMAAASGTHLHADWSAAELASVHPSRTVGIDDDGAIVEIVARKVPSAVPGTWYRVVLVGT